MTSPRGAQDRADELADRLDKLERTTSDALTGPLRRDLDRIGAEALAYWVRAYGGIQQRPDDQQSAWVFLLWLIEQLDSAMRPEQIDPDAASGALMLAYALGIDHVAATTWWTPDTTSDAAPRPRVDLAAPITEQAAKARGGLNVAVLAERGFIPVQEALAKARGAVHRIDARVSHELTSAAAQAVRDVAAERAASVVWIAERDGCLSCLAYAGEVAGPGGVFPPDLTFDVKPQRPAGVLRGPALHPHCRCALQVHHPSDTGIVEGLKREAKRSVLRGWADDGDAARVRAAGRLLSADNGLPQSVQDRARRAVRVGTFERKRSG